MADARASVLLQPEAERMVEELRLMKLEDVGAPAWTKQHQALEKLNMQAQISVMNQGDEFVVEALIDHEKIQLLIQDLLITEAWKEKVLPLVQAELAGAHYVKLYLIMYHEAIVLGLLEKAFFTSTAVAAGGDMLVELADYCYRRTVYLNNVDPNQVCVLAARTAARRARDGMPAPGAHTRGMLARLRTAGAVQARASGIAWLGGGCAWLCAGASRDPASRTVGGEVRRRRGPTARSLLRIFANARFLSAPPYRALRH